MTRPDGIPEDVWQAALKAAGDELEKNLDGFYATKEAINVLVAAGARAILAERERQAESHRDLVDCLSDMTEHYVALAACGDCGNWNPEEEIEVQAARKMISGARAPATPEQVA